MPSPYVRTVTPITQAGRRYQHVSLASLGLDMDDTVVLTEADSMLWRRIYYGGSFGVGSRIVHGHYTLVPERMQREDWGWVATISGADVAGLYRQRIGYWPWDGPRLPYVRHNEIDPLPLPG